MNGITNRKAAFECVVSIAIPGGQALAYEGHCKGLIANYPTGDSGFGYDPVFYYPPLKKCFAEMTTEEKNLISHRGKALKKIRDEFDKILIWIRRHFNK